MSSAQKPKLPINIVPDSIAPGSIIDDRYCVVSDFQHSGPYWQIHATDLARVFGRSPHHRVVLHKVAADHSHEHRLRVAVRADSDVQPRFRELRHLFDGLLIVADHLSGQPLPPVLRAGEALAVAEAASKLLGRLHGAGVRGVRFSREQFVLDQGKAFLVSYGHLNETGTLQSDLTAFHEFLAMLSTALHNKLNPAPKTAMEYAQRFETDSKQFVWTDVLPPLAPYVTPHAVVENIFDLFIEARQGHTREVRVTAPRGYGKTRLLNELAAEITHQGRATVVLAEAPNAGSGSQSVLQKIFEQVTSDLATLPAHRAQQLRQQVSEAVAGFEGVLATAVPKLSVWLGIDHTLEPPTIDIGESFARQASVLGTVLRTIATRRYPLVLLIDRVETLDVASLALFEELRRHPNSHVLLVFACLGRFKLETTPHASHRLPSFGEPQVRELIDRSLPGEVEDPAMLAALLFSATEGRPLNCWAVLQDWVRDGTIAHRGGAWALTRTLGSELVQAERLFEARLENLSDDAFRVLLCLALSDLYLSRNEIVQVLDWSEGRVAAAIRNAMQNAIVQSIEGQLSFTHGTVTELLIHRVRPEVILSVHQRLADWVAEFRPGRIAALAYHREHATHEGKHEELARLHLAAARKTLNVYDAERARWFAQRGLARTVAPDVEASLTRALADALLLAGEVNKAVTKYKKAIDIAPTDESAVKIASECVYALVCRASEGVAGSLTYHALKRAGFSLSDSVRARLWLVLKMLANLIFGVRCTLHAELRDGICALATRSPTAFITDPLGLLATSLLGIWVGKDLKTADASTVIALKGILLAMQGNQSRAATAFSEARSLAESTANSWNLAVVLHEQAHFVYFPQSEFELGTEAMERAILEFRRSGDTSVAVVSYLFLAFYTRNLRSPDETIELLDKALALRVSDKDKPELGVLPVQAFRALLLARKGNHDERDVLALQQSLSLNNVQQVDRLLSAAFLAELFVETGKTEEGLNLALQINEEIKGPQIEIVYHVHLTALRIGLVAKPNATQRKKLRRIRRKASKAAKKFSFLRTELEKISEQTEKPTP